MPPKLQRRVTLSAGEECSLSGSGHLQVTLLSGAMDIAGCALALNTPCSFYLSTAARSLVVYTLEGGSASLASDSPVAIHKAATGAATLVQLVRRTLLGLPTGARVLVVGDHRGGKTLSAHTLVNLIRRHAAEGEDEEGSGGSGSGGGASTRVCLLDLNAESNALFGPGCFTALEVPAGSAPLWLGRTASPALLPLPFFLGTASRPSAKDVGGFIHYCEQLHDTAVAMLAESRAVTGSGKDYMVIDAPAPQADLPEGVFYKKLIQLVRPTHVVVVGDREQRQAADDWCTYLQEDVQRFLPDCDFVFADPCGRPNPQAPRELLTREYFIGSPSYAPLGCSKVVVSAASLLFVSLELDGGGGGGGGASVAARRVTPSRAWAGLVCGLSHAETVEEVPLAPAAGLVLVSAVDEESDEVVLLVPAAQQEPLRRRFVIVPSGAQQDAMRVSETQNATIEESVVV